VDTERALISKIISTGQPLEYLIDKFLTLAKTRLAQDMLVELGR
jgi:hypothetical protein